AVALVEHRGRVLVEQRLGPLLAGLWEPPGVELADGAGAGRAVAAKLEALGVGAALSDSGRRVRHVITHRAITVEVWSGRLTGAAPRRATLRWAGRSRPGLAPRALGRKLIASR